MSHAIITVVPTRTLMRQPDRHTRHLALGKPAVFRHLFHDMAVTVTGRKIHFVVNASGVLAQHLVDNAHRLDELSPVHRAQETKAADAVAHGYLIGSLLLILRLHQLPDRLAALGQPLLKPGKRQ